MPLRGAAYETLRNGVRPPNLCFLNARDQLYQHQQSRRLRTDQRARKPVDARGAAVEGEKCRVYYNTLPQQLSAV